MKFRHFGLLALSLAALLPAPPAAADGPVKPRTAAEEQASFEADRRDIVGMAGAYKVRFDMQESTAWRADYTPIEAKISGGHEVVRVIEDSGRKIVLQHLLVVEHEGKSHVIKHWRQDWEYEPARVLVYAGPDTWKWEAVPEPMRRGRWSQTVYQVDDSPRYGGWGQWTTEGGVRRWRSNWTWRPLARRDAVRGPVYDRYLGINRHQPTPTGWIHWQDNTKMGVIDGTLQPVVQEYVLNSYTRFDGYDVKAADTYWAATKGYWAAIRAEWERIANAKNGIRITEAAEAGTVIASRLLEIADELQAGKTSEADAIALAKKLMDQATRAA
ncbi:DUF6607 family protein [Sphingomonas hengshuiensis]|uniref:Uncharacterized protein n=1 Tax=Sphingomonas hengshuiensis TaxID=1609977 RepID=A0A7U4LF50_9SPHN|nr:DUF6607 family protein [Sphingomonas hengshuiensis]AJP72080.1 hypothetical protein TS85_10210 [Sphingomonas hengshuiensis]